MSEESAIAPKPATEPGREVATAPGKELETAPGKDLEALDPSKPAGPGELPLLTGAIVAAVFGLLLVVTAEIGAVALLVGVALAQAALIVSWVFGTRTPGRIGALIIGSAAAIGADVAVSVSPHGQLGALLPVLGLAVPALFAHQLMRGIARNRVVESLANVAVLVAAVVAIVALIQLRHESSGGSVSAAVAGAAAIALVVGYLTDMTFPIARFDPEVPRGFVAVLTGAVAGAALAFLMLRSLVDFQGGRGAFLGFAVGLLVSLLAVGTGFIQLASAPASELNARLRPVYGVLIPICFVSPIGYLLFLAIRS
ncbi:hypothetical protein [Jatrophihabitans sp. GAS493]|uniref:hypothetical protein n=1 Tax=Jatrophihabitans sp. GAS493 TaxID=1907575 RepID=UPI0012FDCB66|nr:hypothetical protein [Jatrophihabitans sp. GAS493]